MDGMRQSAKLVFKHIEAEIRGGIPSNKIILGGFSQGNLVNIDVNIIMINICLSGAAVALYCAMHYNKPLAGCIALSTMMPEKQLPDPAGIVNKEIPYFQAHGETDNILPLSHGLATSKILKQFLPNHEVCLLPHPSQCRVNNFLIFSSKPTTVSTSAQTGNSMT